MAPKRRARAGLIASACLLRSPAAALCCGFIAFAMAIVFSIVTPASADPAVSENVPLPIPAPLPKSGTAAPAKSANDKTANEKAANDKAANDKAANDKAANDKTQAETAPKPTLFPFSALFGNKASSATPAPNAPEPPSAFDTKQRALLDRISAYLSGVQTMVGKFVQVGPDGGRTEGTF